MDSPFDKIDLRALGVTTVTIAVGFEPNSARRFFLSAETALGRLDIVVITKPLGVGVPYVSSPTFYNFFGEALVFIGGSARDDFLGGANADSLYGMGGDDVLFGGDGADLLYGGDGADTFSFSSHTNSNTQSLDIIGDFRTGVDKLDLSGFRDIVVQRTDNGSSLVFGRTTAGFFAVAAPNATINGFDILSYSAATIIGSSNADAIRGSLSDDTLCGGSGDDVLTGDYGIDLLYGDAGADRFTYLVASDSIVGRADTIFDFVSGLDRIDLRAVRTGSNDTFGIAYTETGSFLFVDLGGNGSNDMLIQLANVRLQLSDVIWAAQAAAPEAATLAAGPVSSIEMPSGMGSENAFDAIWRVADDWYV